MTDAEFTPEELSMIEADRAGVDVPEEVTPEVTPEIDEQKPEEPAKPPEGYVPHGALHEERARRKELQRENQEFREKLARLDEQVKFFKKPENEAPKFDEDPIGFSKHEIDRLHRELANVSKQTPESINSLEQKIELMNMQRNVERQEMQFEKSTPDYRDALTYYAKSRAETFSELGYESEEVHELVAKELQDATRRAIDSGKNPAEIVYKMAKRSGFSGKQDNEKDSRKIDTLKKAESASRSLSDTGGKSKGELSAEALAEMSDDEFKNLSDEDFKRAMGG